MSEASQSTVGDLRDGDVFSYPGQYGQHKLIGSAEWGKRRRLLAIDLTMDTGALYKNDGRVSASIAAAAFTEGRWLKKSTPVLIHDRPGPSAQARRPGGPPPVNQQWWPQGGIRGGLRRALKRIMSA